MQRLFNTQTQIRHACHMQRPANPELLSALNALSSELLAADLDGQYKVLGFWLRPANLRRLTSQLGACRPLGRVLHMAPANMDLVFMYPLVLSLLAGNENWVRISDRARPTLVPLLSLLFDPTLDTELRPIKKALVLFGSEHDSKALKTLCETVDMRLCWGNDTSIRQIRQQLPVPGRDLAFGHKHSLCLIQVSAVTVQTIDSIAERFVRDAFEFDQQACSSPRTLIWLGQPEEISTAQNLFWAAVETRCVQVAPPTASLNLQRLAELQLLTAQGLSNTRLCWQPSLVRLPVTCLDEAQETAHQGHNLFFELAIRDLDELLGQLRPWHQTLTFWGPARQTLTTWAQQNVVPGLDRIEPLGQALQFSEHWDGMDLLALFTRRWQDYEMAQDIIKKTSVFPNR